MAMPKIDLERAITSIVELTLPRFSGPNKFLWIPVSFQLTTFKKNRMEEIRASIHLVFQREHNYTKVFFSEDSQEYQFSYYLNEEEQDKANWVLQSDHDSCWSSDGLRCLSKVYQRLEITLEKKTGQKKTGEFISFGLCGPKVLKGTLEKCSQEVHQPGAYKLIFTKDLVFGKE